uniref:Macro domain-containing protein n=1 Tax=Monodelphis domestica TaxID=13616 RepID=A0A5F8G533_MONDO
RMCFLIVLIKGSGGGIEGVKEMNDIYIYIYIYIYTHYLITKKRASHKSTYENLQKSLEAMKTHCLKNGITDLSMPRIGCGLVLLQWEKVSAMIKDVFEGTDIRITVYTL